MINEDESSFVDTFVRKIPDEFIFERFCIFGFICLFIFKLNILLSLFGKIFSIFEIFEFFLFIERRYKFENIELLIFLIGFIEEKYFFLV